MDNAFSERQRQRQQELAGRIFGRSLLLYTADTPDGRMTSSRSPEKRLMLSQATRPPVSQLLSPSTTAAAPEKRARRFGSTKRATQMEAS
jgi:hypothetical protein